MGYLAFARKYRPQKFDEVIGQDDVVGSLTKAVKEGRLHHAYIFSGTRGVGKTTLARIMAKSLNCLSYDEPTIAPCGTCTSCQDIQQSRSVDVIEIDGASNTGVDNIRELRENVKFSPSYSRYKIYIIDEVHRISQQAFDALLKTLEEPPAHVKFIMATTELNKVPVTILSRCQKFNFNLVLSDNIIKKLKSIAGREGFTVSDEIYRYLAKASLGSVRDAESIFDQVAPLLMNGAGFEDILDMLGEVREFALLEFIEMIIKKDAGAALLALDSVVKQGRDIEKFVDSLTESLRNVMLVSILKDDSSDLFELPQDIREKTVELAGLAPAAFFVRAIDAMIEVKRTSRYVDSMRVPLELAVVRLIYTQTQAKTAVMNPAAGSVENQSVVRKPVQAVPAQMPAAVVKESKKTSLSAGPVPQAAVKLTDDNITDAWKRMMALLEEEKVVLYNNLSVARIIDISADMITIGFPKNCEFQKTGVERSNNIEAIQEAFLRTSGLSNVRIKTSLLDVRTEMPRLKDHAAEYVNDVVEAFGGEII